MHSQDHPSTSVNFSFIRKTSRQLSSNCRASVGPSDNFCQLSVRAGSFREFPSTFRASAGPFINFLCVCKTLRLLLPTFRVSVGPSISFHQLSVHTLHHSSHLRQLFVRSQVILLNSVNFLCDRGTFRKFLSSFCVSVGTFANFPCVRATFHQLSSTFCVPQDLPSASVNFSCVLRTFHQILSSFCTSVGTSVNFHQLFISPLGISSTFRVVGRPFVNFCQLQCSMETFHQLSMYTGDHPSTSV